MEENIDTENAYQYILYDTKLNSTCVSFQVKAAQDALVGFFNSFNGPNGSEGIYDSPWNVDFYEIIIGEWCGLEYCSSIRASGQGEDQGTVYGSWLDESEFKQFWACAIDGWVSVGEGEIANENVITMATFSQKYNVQYVGFSTGLDSELISWRNITELPHPCYSFEECTSSMTNQTSDITWDDLTIVEKGIGIFVLVLILCVGVPLTRWCLWWCCERKLSDDVPMWAMWLAIFSAMCSETEDQKKGRQEQEEQNRRAACAWEQERQEQLRRANE